MKTSWVIIFFLILFMCLVIFTNNTKEGLDTTSTITAAQNYTFFGGKQVKLNSNMALSFIMNINTTFGNWQQVIGITPDSGGQDQRVLSVWLCPGNSNLYIRTATTTNGSTSTNWDDEISSNSINIPLGQNVEVCIIGNLNTSGSWPYSQNWQVYINGSQVVNKNIARSYYPTAFKEAYVKTTYSGFQPFNGKLSNVIFMSTDSQINYNLVKQENSQMYNGFSNYLNVEGMANEQTATIGKADSSYLPILDTNTDKTPLCPNTVLFTDQDNSNSNTLLDTNLNMLINGKKVPICDPDELYKIQKVILAEINTFNAEYMNFMTYKYNQKHTGNGDTAILLQYPSTSTTDVQLSRKYSTVDKVTDLASYIKLDTDLTTYNNLLAANTKYYPKSSKLKNVSTLGVDHDNIVKLRNDLDQKLYELNNGANSIYANSKLQMDSGIYITILWTTLATSLVYYMFVHM